VSIGDVLFGCSHARTSFPRSCKPRLNHSEMVQQAETYVVCLDCGKEFAYDWEEMRVLGPLKKTMQKRLRTKASTKWNAPILSRILAVTGLTDEKKEAA